MCFKNVFTPKVKNDLLRIQFYNLKFFDRSHLFLFVCVNELNNRQFIRLRGEHKIKLAPGSNNYIYKTKLRFL